ncbi:MAG: ABC transporter substrate-binding protein [Candidatus Rokubacteria bacterium]|nr:ABC transporter substrate-binding protein [Candidatus Rokubacteria bacterium]
MTHWTASMLCALTGLTLALAPAAVDAQARALDGVAIDPDAELVVALADDTNNMDPRIGMGSIRSNYIRQVFESLVDVDSQGKPVPGLALAWKPVGDLAWEFSLRRGVTFHDGEPFNAEVVLFNLDRMFRRNLDRWGIKDVAAGTSFEKVFPFVSRWEKVDDYTVRVHTSEPSATLWDFIGREPLVPRAWTTKHGVEALNERPIGTGPWKLVEWKRKDHMSFERWERYWGNPPLYKRMRFQTIPEAAARIAALRAGQVGLIEAVPPLDADVLKAEPKVQVSTAVQKLVCRLYLNGRPRDKYDSGGKDGLFTDARVRMAFNLAVNKEAIVRKIFNGYARVNASPVASVSFGYAPQEPYAYDPRKAKALLMEAGWKESGGGWIDRNGEPVNVSLLFPAKHYGQAFDEMTTAVVEMIKEIGVPVTVKPVDFGTQLQVLQKGALPARAPGPLHGEPPRAGSGEAPEAARRPAAAGPRLGARGLALPGGQDLRGDRARAPLHPDPRAEHGLPGRRAPEVTAPHAALPAPAAAARPLRGLGRRHRRLLPRPPHG